MVARKYNFSAGPAVLPLPVLEEAREALLSLGDTGIGILEHSHRGAAFREILEETEALCRELAGIPDDYHVLFLQGGASTQFFMVPMSFLTPQVTADYLITGSWSKKAYKEAQRFGNTHIAATSEPQQFTAIPPTQEYSASPVYVHMTSNNTIYGTQYQREPEIPPGSWLVCDASSDIFSRPLDVTKYGLIYAGAQKNLGPAGVTLVIIHDELVKAASDRLPTMLQYRTHVEHRSSYNTPPTFGIYVMGLVFKWLKAQGGLEVMQQRNREKADRLYRYLDESRLFRPTVEDKASRSMMNVTFVTGDAACDQRFLQRASEAGLEGLKGHRSVGGMRASLYNAFPPEGVDALISLMREFEAEQG